MPSRIDLPHAEDELHLIVMALEAGLCSRESFAASLGRARSAVVQYLTGKRSAPGGLLLGLLWHLGHAERVTVIGWLCELLEVHPGEVLLKVARDQVRAEVWGEVVELAETKRGGENADPLELRRAA